MLKKSYLVCLLFLHLIQHAHFSEEEETAGDYLVLSESEKMALRERGSGSTVKYGLHEEGFPSASKRNLGQKRGKSGVNRDAQNLDVAKAQEMLLNTLKWRQANDMDTILTEDWADMKDDYPLDNDTHDKKGRPIATVNLGSWNVLRAALTGKMPRLTRYLANLLESSARHVIEEQEEGKKNITQFKILINLDGFNGIQHTCAFCLPMYQSFITMIQNYYTGYAHKVILINTPIVFKTVLDLIQPLFTPRTKKILRIYGTTRQQWIEYLDKAISRDQRRPEFGGTKADR